MVLERGTNGGEDHRLDERERIKKKARTDRQTETQGKYRRI